MEYVPVSSSAIAAIGYDEGQAILGVKLVAGAEYHYYGVPRDVYDGCITATSVGQYYNSYVKAGGYSFEKVG